MQWHGIGAVARHAAIVTGISAGMLTGFPTAADVGAQPRGHSFYMTAVEFRGSTSTDKLAPPSIDPLTLPNCHRAIPTKRRGRPIRSPLGAGKSAASSSAHHSSLPT